MTVQTEQAASDALSNAEQPGRSFVAFARLKPGNQMPKRARDWVTGVAASRVATDVLDTLRLLTSELATNALQHGFATGIVRVALLTCPQGLRVEVTNDGDGTPAPRSAAEGDEDGRGLFLLDALARAWGHDRRANGKGPWSGSRSTPRRARSALRRRAPHQRKTAPAAAATAGAPGHRPERA
ncbi:ATP-binding protein [Actinocorallia herbida]|uniref:ATP-binding protein n=1 Tax=Actinocorallia herbida TaxID=58109 RepID=UPI001476F24E|nr:ATP-binding protein [Actinocorallia herbida]